MLSYTLNLTNTNKISRIACFLNRSGPRPILDNILGEYMKLRSCFIAFGLLVSMTAIANPSFASNKNNCCQPICCDKGSFYASVKGVWAEPMETGVGMFTDSWQYLSSDGAITAISKKAKFSNEFAGGGDIGYRFANTCTSIKLSYFGLNNTLHAVNGPEGAFSFGSVFFPNIAVLSPTFISDAHLKYNLNQYDLVLDHTYSNICGFSLRPSLGIRYADYEHKLTFAVPGNVISKFKGAGPVVGVDAYYALGHCGLGLVGHIDGALLDGTVDSHSFINFPTTFNYKQSDEDHLVPTCSINLGLNYRHAIGCQSIVSIEAGYEATKYFDSAEILRGNVPGFAGEVTPRIVDVNTTSFGYSGPYLKLSYAM